MKKIGKQKNELRNYEPKRKNPISLGSDSNLDKDLKPIIINDLTTNLELSIDGTFIRDELQTDSIFTDKLTTGSILGDATGEIFVEADDVHVGFALSGGFQFKQITLGHNDSYEARLKINSVVDSNDYFEVASSGFAGSGIIQTVEGADDDGGTAQLFFRANNNMSFKIRKNASDYTSGVSQKIGFSHGIAEHGKLWLKTANEFELSATDDYDLILSSGGTGDIRLYCDTEVRSDNPLKIKEAANAVADTAAYGQLWVKTATPNELYFTTDAGNDIALTSGTSAAGGGGGTSRWHQTIGGYKINNNSTSNYYTIYRFGYDNWSNSDSSPTSLSNYDSYSTAFTAPADGTLTNITVVGQAQDTGATDAFKFYVYKAVPPHNGTTTTATLIGTTSAISTSATTRVYNVSTDISSSNTFSAGDSLYIWLKKDATSGNQDLYFSVTFSGEYD